MTKADKQVEPLHPDKAIRRFDVFAEYSRQERLDKGYPKDEAKGYGIWLAKVVAARKFSKSGEERKTTGHKQHAEEEPRFKSVGDEMQTDVTFDRDIIDRMGEDFYADVFSPAIAMAHEDGKTYEEIRDSIRKDWKPSKRKSK
jgi:hypothetical protein